MEAEWLATLGGGLWVIIATDWIITQPPNKENRFIVQP